VTRLIPSDLSRLHVLIPLRSLAGGKARLGGAIDAEERETLLRGLLVRTMGLVRAWPASEMVHVVSTDPDVLAAAKTAMGAGEDPLSRSTDDGPPLRALIQRGEGLNEALRLARDEAIRAGATAVLMLPADLPLLSAEPLDRLLLAADAAVTAGSGRAIVVVAPADARGGTNALLLSPPDVIEPCFGTLSLEAHLRAAAFADASLQIVDDARLGFDLDTPEDLERLEPDRLHELTRLGGTPATTVR
jgi:2-phospho-L-lactate guanylyltransferase